MAVVEERLVWTAERYLQLVDAGLLDDLPDGGRAELLAGDIVTEMPQGSLHLFVFRALQAAFAARGVVAPALVVAPTLVVGERNVLDPEFALLPGTPDHRRLPHASETLLVVEVAVTSRERDLGSKALAYARAGAPLYWVIDAVARTATVLSDPGPEGYRSCREVREGEELPLPNGSSLRLSCFPTED